MDALIGNTGFVGGALCHQHAFAAKFNSRTIEAAAGQHYRIVVCAAAPGSMFDANRFPKHDKKRLDGLIAQLRCIHAERFVLISSIAVFDNFSGAYDEATAAYTTDRAYGKNRRLLEVFCQEHFADCLIVRLPALFGDGLKKNFLYDVLNPIPTMLSNQAYHDLLQALSPKLCGMLPLIYTWQSNLEMYVVDRVRLQHSGCRSDLDVAVINAGLSALSFTHPDSSFQYYDVKQLWSDIMRCEDARLEIVHLATQPLRAGKIFHAITNQSMAVNSAHLHHEDMRTRHSVLWGRDDGYIEGADSVLRRIKQFYEKMRKKSYYETRSV